MPERKQRNVGALAARWDDVQVVGKLLLDDQVSAGLKLLPLLAVLYLIFPIDLIPDLALGLGQLDDIGVVLLALTTFIRMAPPARVARARGDLSQEGGEWVDGAATRKDEEP